MGLRRKRNRSAAKPGPKLVEVPVGFDRTAASMIVARCQEEDIPVQLLTMDENGLAPGIAALAEHRVLIREQDRDRVVAIVHRS